MSTLETPEGLGTVRDMTPLVVTSKDYPAEGGHAYVLAPDERIPSGSWAIDLEAFASYNGVTYTGKDEALVVAQIDWNIAALDAAGFLTRSSPDGDVWDLDLPDGWKAEGLVISGEVAGVVDLRKCLKGLQWDDSYYQEHTYPLPGGQKRYIRGVHPENPNMVRVGDGVTIGDGRGLEAKTPAERQKMLDLRERSRAKR